MGKDEFSQLKRCEFECEQAHEIKSIHKGWTNILNITTVMCSSKSRLWETVSDKDYQTNGLVSSNKLQEKMLVWESGDKETSDAYQLQYINLTESWLMIKQIDER